MQNSVIDHNASLHSGSRLITVLITANKTEGLGRFLIYP